MQETPKSSRFFDPLAIKVAAGSTIKAAAEAAGCSLPVAYSISRSTEFRNAVSEIRTAAIQEAVGVLSAGATAAAACLVELLQDEDPKVRLAAAVKLLEKLTPLTELHELRVDVQLLKEQAAIRPRIAQ